MSTTKDTLARISALEAKVEAQTARIAALETANARLVECMGRFMAIIDNQSLVITEWAVDEFTARDEEAVQTRDELEIAIRSRAPRGFKFPITVHETVVSPVTIIKNTFKKPYSEQTLDRWGEQLRYISGLAETHQIILKRNGMIDEHPAPSAEDW